MKKVLTVILLVLTTLFLGGCWDRNEVNEMAWVMAIGVDLGSEPDTYLVTYQVVLPKKGGEVAETNSWTISVEGKTIRETLEAVYAILYKRPFVGTMKVVVLGEELARKRGINEVIDFIQRDYAFRLTMNLMITPGKAKDVLNAQLRTEQTTSLSLLLLLENREKISISPSMTMEHYLPSINAEKAGMVLPVVKAIEPNKEIQFDGQNKELLLRGGAVLRQDRLVGFLSDDETRGFMWLDDQVKERQISVEFNEREWVSGSVHQTKTKYKVIKKGGVITVVYRITGKINFKEIQVNQEMDPTEFKNFSDECEKKFEDLIAQECQKAIAKSREMQVDFLNIGKKVRMKYPKYWREVENRWEEVLQEIPIEVEVDVKTTYSGGTYNGPINREEQGNTNID